MKPKVVVTGLCGADVLSFLADQDAGFAEKVGVCADEEPRVVAWRISTKYYEADVEVVAVSDPHSDCLTGLDKVQAVVVSLEGDSLDTKVLEMFEEAESKVCVTRRDPSGVPNELLDKLCELGVELVHIGDNSLEQQDALERKGLDRVLEVLEVTMWENMELKNGAAKPNDDMEDLGDDEGGAAQDEQGLVFEEEDELGFDFDSMFQQISAIRENSKNLSDEERKKAAANMALKFAKMLNLEED